MLCYFQRFEFKSNFKCFAKWNEISFLCNGELFSKLKRFFSIFRPIFLHFWQICPNEMSSFFENGSLSKGFKQDNFEPHNSLERNFTNIRGLRSNFVECESFLESNCPDILVLRETNLDDSIDSGNFSVRGYVPLV